VQLVDDLLDVRPEQGRHKFEQPPVGAPGRQRRVRVGRPLDHPDDPAEGGVRPDPDHQVAVPEILRVGEAGRVLAVEGGSQRGDLGGTEDAPDDRDPVAPVVLQVILP
jgi:hypothetical protein